MKAFLIRIRPADRKIIGFKSHIDPQIMQRLVKYKLVANRELVSIPGKGIVRYARAHRPFSEYASMPRWRLGECEPVSGEVILFGMNADSRADHCPVTVAFVRKNLTWLEPLSAIGGALLAPLPAAPPAPTLSDILDKAPSAD